MGTCAQWVKGPPHFGRKATQGILFHRVPVTHTIESPCEEGSIIDRWGPHMLV